MNMKEEKPTLSQAPQHIQLAVDLIYLLETNEIDPNTALAALKIVEHDLLAQLKRQPIADSSNK
jgi:hypothetical protein